MTVKTWCLPILALGIAGCGGTGQDDGTPSEFSREYAGLAIDGYLARSTVFLDTNNDGARNAWEPFAFTDNQGYFSYNPITDTDYCADSATAEQAQYCLRTNSQYDNVVLRIDSGYDVVTGEPFSGQISRRVGADDASETQPTIISPLTSLVTNLSTSEEQRSVLGSLGLQENALDLDYLNTDGSGQVDIQVFNAALKLHKVVTVLGDRITDTYDEIGEQSGTPYDATSTVYSALAEQLLTTTLNFDSAVADSSVMSNVLDSTEAAMQSVYRRKEIDLPTPPNADQVRRVIDVAADLVEVVNRVVDVNQTDATNETILGQARAVESVVIKALEERGQDQSLDNAINFFTDEQNSALVSSLLEGLGSETSDLASLAQNDFQREDFDSPDELASVSQLPADAEPFAQVGGLQIKVSDLDLGFAPDDLDDSEIELYFSGEMNAISGSFTACVKHIDGANIDGTLGEGNSRGELVDGFWSLLGASTDNVASYSLLVTIQFLGTTYQAIMKPAGRETIDGINYQRIRFDNDGEINIWHSEEGLVTQGEVPQTDADCEVRLPSRVGI